MLSEDGLGSYWKGNRKRHCHSSYTHRFSGGEYWQEQQLLCLCSHTGHQVGNGCTMAVRSGSWRLPYHDVSGKGEANMPSWGQAPADGAPARGWSHNSETLQGVPFIEAPSRVEHYPAAQLWFIMCPYILCFGCSYTCTQCKCVHRYRTAKSRSREQ